MSYFKREALFGYLLFQFAALLLGLLIYGRNGVHLDALLLMFLLIQFVFGLLHLNNPHSKISRLCNVLNLCLSVYFLWGTGGLSSPFLCYFVIGLLVIKQYADWRFCHAVWLLYLAALPIVLALLYDRAVLPYIEEQLQYGFYILFFYGAVGTVQYWAGRLKIHFRKLDLIYASREKLSKDKGRGQVLYMEELLREILGNRTILLCMDDSSVFEKSESWTHTYYNNYFNQHPLEEDSAYRYVPSPTGQIVSLYIQTLRLCNGQRYGWLLVEAEPDELAEYHKKYMKLILAQHEVHYEYQEILRNVQKSAVTLERDHIAQNIHDGIAQELFFISIQLFQLRSALSSEISSETVSILTEIEKKVKESHRGIRSFIVELKDEKRKFNLHHAIQQLLKRITVNTGIHPVFEHSGWIPHERLEIEETIYHLVEEAVNNVVKHAEAKRLSVQVNVTSVQWTVIIQDDGKGMPGLAADTKGKFGLNGMENRIKALNGSLSFHSEELAGTTITAFIPRDRSTTYV
ncbi:sensor histidine kinase [Paenibacillus hexagrammi]|uniref:histidine kinase n=1 Tax=Paenibacillus hexagrammi TaxID=2908839 RepID=A0ABY3SIL1_9BACL|nr:ATP-binding protein [Paenibacillus sp. YPD9-1]UJF32986.1 ATP-binding protein [Paenibacillus sp. YPD9-1]